MKETIENLLIKSPQLLIVDDDTEQLAQMVDWLSERDGQLYQARSSEQALKILSKQWIDAVITDWQLPEMSGLELIQRLRSARFRGPLLICTGMMLSPEHLRQAFAAGANDYLRKPLNSVELNARLDNSLQLYAHREILHLFSRSQQGFIAFLSRSFGLHLERLRQLQHLERQTGSLGEEAPALTETMIQAFHKLMLWARYRFSLRHVQFRRFELRQLFKSVENSFATQAHRLSFRGGREVYLYSDAELLQRILQQLVDNALRYSEGPVTIKASQESQGLRLAVIDQGQTLTEGELARLVDRQQAGLGLHICHDLLELLNSRLQARKTTQYGNQFFFELVSP